MMHRGFGMFRGGGLVGIIIIAIALYFLIKYLNENKKGSSGFNQNRSAMDILNERYAKGEIDDEEYDKRKKMLKD